MYLLASFLTKSAGFWLTFILVTRSKLYQIDNKNSIVSHPITTTYLHPLNTKTGKDKFLTLPLHFIIALSHNAPALIVLTPPYILSLLYTHIHTHTHTHTHTHKHTHTHTHTHTQTHTDRQTDTHIKDTHTQTHTCTKTHTDTQVWPFRLHSGISGLKDPILTFHIIISIVKSTLICTAHRKVSFLELTII